MSSLHSLVWPVLPKVCDDKLSVRGPRGGTRPGFRGADAVCQPGKGRLLFSSDLSLLL